MYNAITISKSTDAIKVNNKGVKSTVMTEQRWECSHGTLLQVINISTKEDLKEGEEWREEYFQ